MSYTIQYLAQDGEWCSTAYMKDRCKFFGGDERKPVESVEASAKWLSELDTYKDTPIRTLYGDSDSPVSVYVNGYNVREDWISTDYGHPHLQVTI